MSAWAEACYAIESRLGFFVDENYPATKFMQQIELINEDVKRENRANNEITNK